MDWPMHSHVERQAVRMHAMMDRLNVDVPKLARLRCGDAYAEARTRCLLCGTTDKCLRWLDGFGRQDLAPAFCPNLREFQKCLWSGPAHAARRLRESRERDLK